MSLRVGAGKREAKSGTGASFAPPVRVRVPWLGLKVPEVSWVFSGGGSEPIG